jgi:GT2 family glycosyltransferase
LESLERARAVSGPLDIVVVDTGSSDGSPDLIRSRYSHVAGLVELRGAAAGAARNAGAAAVRGEILSFVDADCLVAPEYFERAKQSLESSGAMAVGYAYGLPPSPHWIERVWDALHRPPTEGYASWLYAGNLVIRRGAFASVGGFDPRLLTGEDTEFAARLRRAGMSLYLDPALVVTHLGNPRTIRAFAYQQWWHGLGMLGTARLHKWRDLPLVAVLVHVLLMLGAPVIAAARFGPAGVGIGLLAAQLPVPIAAMLLRWSRTRRIRAPGRGLLLYVVYFACRVAALSSVAFGWPAPQRSRR